MKAKKEIIAELEKYVLDELFKSTAEFLKDKTDDKKSSAALSFIFKFTVPIVTYIFSNLFTFSSFLLYNESKEIS